MRLLKKNIFLNHSDIVLPVVYGYFISCDVHLINIVVV